MNICIVCLIGAIVCALDGVGIFYAPEEPYKNGDFICRRFKGSDRSPDDGFAMQKQKNTWLAVAMRILFGFFFAAVISLAKGGMKSSMDHLSLFSLGRWWVH